MGLDPLDPSVTEALRGWLVQYAAGIAPSQALELAAAVCRTQAARAAFAEAAQRAARGADAAELLAALEAVLPEGERAVLAAGFKSGRLDAALGSVVAKRELWHATRAKIRARLALPGFILLLAALIIPLPGLVLGGSMWAYALSVAAPLAVAFGVWGLAGAAVRARIASRVQSAQTAPAPVSGLDRLLLNLPVVAGLERTRNLGESAGLLADLLGAGVVLSEALATCANTAPNGAYRADLSRAARQVLGGRSLAQSLPPGRLWPADFCAALAVGEQAGALEETCRRLGRQHREQYAAAIEQLGEWLPRLLYVLLVLFVLLGIFQVVEQIIPRYDGLQGSP
jgi:type II secretory pathway component PulF